MKVNFKHFGVITPVRFGTNGRTYCVKIAFTFNALLLMYSTSLNCILSVKLIYLDMDIQVTNVRKA